MLSAARMRSCHPSTRRVGDLEAIEDYMAIGKGDIKDGEGRGALHYAVRGRQGRRGVRVA